jgi:hypothetical protein
MYHTNDKVWYMNKKGIYSAIWICKNPSTAVQRIFDGFYMLVYRFIVIISLRARDKIGTFLLRQSYIYICMTGRLKMCTFWFFVFSRYTLQKLSGLTWSVLVSTVTHVKLLNMISHIFTTKRPLGTYHSALKREFYKESPCINNGKMVYNQKVHIFNRPVIFILIQYVS